MLPSSSSGNFMLIALAVFALLGCTTQGVAAANLRGSQAPGEPSRSLDATPTSKPVISTDFTTVQAFRQQFQADEFVVDLKALKPTTSGGGEIKTANVIALPSLHGEGIALVTIDLAPCGINIPHVHTRATEFLYAIDAESVQTTFVEENGGRAITNTIATGQAAFFPKGLVHYQYNTSCKPARLLAALGHEDFGVQTVSTTALANLPTEGLAAALGITQAELTAAIAKFPANPAQSAECLQRCKAAGSLP